MLAVADMLSEDEIVRALADLNGWAGDAVALRRTAVLPSFAAAIEVVDAVARQAEEMDHHPDIDIRWRTLSFTCATHSANGVTALDVDLASRIDTAIAGANVPRQPE